MMMRRLLRASLAALLLGVVVTSASAQKSAGSASWWPTWGQTPAKKTPEKSDGKAKPKLPSSVDRDEEYKRLQSTLDRRLQVCDELRRVALETGDDKLEEEVTVLADTAMKIFVSRSEKLLSPSGPGTTEAGQSDDALTQTRDMILKHAEQKRGMRR
jgi:hypothetical protein